MTILKPGNIHVLRSTESRGQLLVAAKSELDVVTNAGIEVQDLLEKLARAVLAGKKKKIKYLVHTILNSPAAKLSALVRTIHYDVDMPPYTLTELLRRARSLFPYARIDEPVHLRLKEKDSGELRPVLCFGWQRRALQKLCGDILKVLLPAYPFDFMEKGNGGPDGAAKYLGAIIKEGQYDFVVTVDIKNCFRSVNKAGIAQLLSPLPTPVTNNVLLIMDDITIGKERYDLGYARARRRVFYPVVCIEQYRKDRITKTCQATSSGSHASAPRTTMPSGAKDAARRACRLALRTRQKR